MTKSFFLKTFIVFSIILSNACFANDLGALMKTMNGQFKTLSKQSSDPALATQNADLTAEFRKTTNECLQFPPHNDAIVDVTEQRIYGLQFQSMIIELMDDTTKLEEAFLKSNAADIQALIEKIKQIKSDGHSLFKP